MLWYLRISINKGYQKKIVDDKDLENISNFGPRESFPTDFAELLNTSDFKTEILRFLFIENKEPIYGPIIWE